ncbi:hypothetical protein E1211_13960 [Micromonospora sp. 15K316]|uniref:hypothetical protein n=1 Tax=Micromonospora sp. 15K316 TaxID=2530376 RepID=UPI001047CDAD|nr:hypothetical protein [Micromonospora sp. 15K316]TDC36286.1 hypothetical protein E1211_13960 [Micromonospora sp. 15K316]
MSRGIRKKHLLAGLATAGVLGVGIAAPTMAFAADGGTPTPSAGTTTGGDRQKAADHQGKFAEELAKELGVPTEKVTDALKKLRAEHKADRPQRPSAEDRQARLKERLDRAVKDGKLTQEQADAIAKAVEAGVFPGGPGGHGRHGGWGGHRSGDSAPEGTTGS